MSIVDLLREPLARDVADLDDGSTVDVHARIIAGKPFLRRLYQDFYRSMVEALGPVEGPVLELGSGGGFSRSVIPGIVTSDVVEHEGIDHVFPAEEMPFDDAGLSGIVMLNVFHHLTDPTSALREMARVLEPGGAVAMIEPANTRWGRWVFTHLHHEPFDPDGAWESDAGGRLSDANGALPWIVFRRDRDRFDREVPGLDVESVSHHTPIAYLLTGGLSWRSSVPGWAFRPLRALERGLCRVAPSAGMFMTVVLRRRESVGPVS